METLSTTLPVRFVERLQAIVPPARLAETLASFDRPKIPVLRVNTLRSSVMETFTELQSQGFPLDPLPKSEYAASLPPEWKRPLTETAAFAEGRIYLQNPSSMLAVEVLAPRPGEEVLDLCAAPGGKTSLLAMKMGNRGRIAAVEPVKDRFYRLKANLTRLGVTVARGYRMDGRAVGHKVPERFDRVLVDAPCSSESRFRSEDPQSHAHWHERKIAECSRKQKRLLLSAFQALKPGGRLLYCTCAFAPEENEMVVDALLLRHPEAEIVPFQLPGVAQQPGLTRWQGKTLAASLKEALRILPDRIYDGFFLCLVTKGRGVGAKAGPARKDAAAWPRS
ncbi:tRNA (cytosine49-C5)-methyltransferase [Methylomarinovum tepidoasis]|uniref:tRNA (Cytosine49-C5)-methyltransferase n=1 Tax=Methylomarinovum tepidoasis TaxID=2840183 RepID=A0AAU9CXT2_9GAMM|nr:tRNA (cytosine49-C5)-methyltransferase [Methylomarinovum sp. IN45]